MSVTAPVGQIRVVNGLGSWTCDATPRSFSWTAPTGWMVIAFHAYAARGEHSEDRHALPVEVAGDGKSVTIYTQAPPSAYVPAAGYEDWSSAAWATLLAVAEAA